MRTNYFPLHKVVLLLLANLTLFSISRAATQTKAGNSDALNLASSWVSGTVPGAADSALWSSVAGSNPTASLGADTTWDTVVVTNATGTVTINGSNTLTLAGTGANHGINANNSTTADLTINTNVITSPSTQTWAIAAGHTLTMSGTITATNTALTLGSAAGNVDITGSLITTKQIVKNGGGTLWLSGSNQITGGIQIATGYVLLSSAQAVQSTISTVGAATTITQIQLSGGYNFGFSPNLGSAHANAQTTGAQVVNLDGNNTVGNINYAAASGTYGIRSDGGTLNVTGILGTGNSGTARTLEIGGAGDIVVSGSISDGNTVGNRVVAVDKFGTGTLTLKGASAYEGATTVQVGTLLVSGTLSSSPVTVNSSGALAGGGLVAAVNIQTGGTLAPGTGFTGILKTQNLSLAGTLSSNLSKAPARSGLSPLAGTDYNQASVAGTVTLTGADLKLTLGAGVQTNDLYFLINNDSTDAVSGVFASLAGVTTDLSQGATFLYGGQAFQISYTADSTSNTFAGTGNDVALLAVSVPEPATCGMLLSGLGALLIFKKRKSA